MVFAVSFSNAEEIKNNAREAFIKRAKTFTSEDFIRINAPKRTNPEQESALHNAVRSNKNIIEKGTKQINTILNKKPEILNEEIELPERMTLPGEFEETQAVVISWPSYAFDSLGREVYPFLPGIGVYYYGDEEDEYELVPIVGYVADLFEDSPLPPIWQQLTDAIQHSAEVWIRIPEAQDSSDIKLWMQISGTPLVNYRFIHDELGYNAFWMRDFGPIGVYYGDNDDLGFVSFSYYPGRPIDDMFPQQLGNILGYSVFENPVEIEGGNIISDGNGRGFYSNVLYPSNRDTLGPTMEYKEPLTDNQVDSLLARYLGFNQSNVLDRLVCDGGTGHIDLYMKMMEEDHFFISQFPDVFNKTQFRDWNTVVQNVNHVQAVQSVYEDDLYISRLPIPTDDWGSYSKTTCNAFFNDPRNYINGLTVNGTFIFPSYSDNVSGNKAGDEAAMELMKLLLPGYKLVPLDSRLLVQWGGAVHCITMQIPAENPVKILHQPYRLPQNIKDSYHFSTEIYNHSGIAEAVIHWRLRGTDEWNSIEMNLQSGLYTADILNDNFTSNDNIEYYIETLTNNGKTAYKPITAPSGYYSFSLADPVSVEDYSFNNSDLMNIHPNPATERISFNLIVENEEVVEVFLTDILGNTVAVILNETLSAGIWSFNYSVSNIPAGVYSLSARGNRILSNQKVIISK